MESRSRQIVYDLTEVLLAATGRLKYYGIARVVAEIAVEIVKQRRDIRFAVYSTGHRKLFEIKPILQEDGSVDLNVPLNIEQRRMRRIYHKKSVVTAIFSAVGPFVDIQNRRKWNDVAAHLEPLDCDHIRLVSCGRPKLIVDMMDALDRQKVDYDVVPMLHDMIPLHDFKHKGPKFQSNFEADNAYIVGRAKALLSNSIFSKNEILLFADAGVLPKPPKIYPVPLVHECPEGTEAPGQVPPPQPYILAVGTSLGRKNLNIVLDAMSVLKRRGGPLPNLVLAGARRQATDTHLESADRADIRDLVIFRENPNQTDLVALYRRSTALIMASRMEGWGLPAGEALWLGTPAICSTAPVLKEVAGDLGLYFDPDDAVGLADHITRLMTDSAFTEKHRARIASAKPTLRQWSNVEQEIQDALKAIEAHH